MPGSGKGGSCLTPKVYCLNGSPQERGQKNPEKQRSQGIEREDG